MDERYPKPTTQQHSTKTQSILKKIYYTFLTSNLGFSLLIADVVAAGWSTSIGVDMMMMMREDKRGDVRVGLTAQSRFEMPGSLDCHMIRSSLSHSLFLQKINYESKVNLHQMAAQRLTRRVPEKTYKTWKLECNGQVSTTFIH
jgi:hypothetical protein